MLTYQDIGRVNCPCLEQGRNPNSQLSSAISASFLPIELQDQNQPSDARASRLSALTQQEEEEEPIQKTL